MEGTETKMITGQCHCGAIQYEAQGPVLRQGICQCRGCQRATGGLWSPSVGVAQESFRIKAGTPTQFQASSNEACDSGTWNLCSKCGSQLFWTNAAGTELAIFAGTLDDTRLFRQEDGK